MSRRDTGSLANASSQMFNAGETGSGDAMSHRGNGIDANASSQMSTHRDRAAMTRWVIEATGSMRMLHRRCQRIGTGQR